MKNKKSKVRFYTEAEYQVLLPAIEGKQKLTAEFLAAVSKKINRSEFSVRQYIYEKRSKLGYTKKNFPIVDNSKQTSSSSFRQGEFVIPITNWEVRTINGAPNLVLKFGKSL